MKKTKKIRLSFFFFSLVYLSIAHLSFSDTKIFIKEDSLKEIAQDFSYYLEKIKKERFEISKDKFENSGILLGLTGDCQDIGVPSSLKDKSLEAFYIKANKEIIVIIGNSPIAVQHGTYTYLYQLGCRWFFPGERWTIIPEKDSVYLDFETLQDPDFKSRRIWYAYGAGAGEKWKSKKIARDYAIWSKGNLLGGISNFSCGHSWGGIVSRNKKEFEEHPEYFALQEDGKSRYNTGNVKFCCSNPGLLELVAKDRIKLLGEEKRNNPYSFMVSVDPSDGHGYCLCENCKKLGNSTDRVIYLANYVAKKIREVYSDGWVGLYAYSDHQIPPTIDIEPNVYIQIAMAFNRTQYTYDELIEAWGGKAGAIGIREYYGVMAWDWDLPGKGRGGNIKYHKEKIPYWKKHGATSINAETTNGWGYKGPGQYIAAKLMWDVNANVYKLTDDFFEKSFGKAKAEIKELYKMWEGTSVLTNGDIYEYIEKLRISSEIETDKNIQKRLNDLKAYLHYVILYYDFQNSAEGEDARKKFFNLMEYTYRIKTRNMVHSYALARRIANYKFPSKLFKGLAEEERGKEERKNIIEKWWIFNKNCEWQKNENEITDEEIESLFLRDYERFKEYKNEAVSFSKNLVYISRDEIEGVKKGGTKDLTFRFENTFYVLFESEKVSIETEGIGNTTVSLCRLDGEVIENFNIRKGEKKEIILTADKKGLYKIVFNGHYRLKFPEDLKFLGEASKDSQLSHSPYAGPCYFYVPKRTKKVIAYYGARLIITKPDGKVEKYLSQEKPSPVEIEVGEGNDGKIWCVDWLTAGGFFFLNVPPYCSFSDRFILLPKEVIKRDNL